jgi:uncharacterized protein (DUF427 family)
MSPSGPDGGERVKPRRIPPGPGQESVWDYPRPPRVERSARRATVVLAGTVVADSSRALRVLETAGPPTIYIPRADVEDDLLRPTRHHSFCEWKGRASYLDVVVGDRTAPRAAWTYPRPKRGYEVLVDHVSFYPGRVDACYLGGELVRPQPGRFYGGWITDDIVGPFKGIRGSGWW